MVINFSHAAVKMLSLRIHYRNVWFLGLSINSLSSSIFIFSAIIICNSTGFEIKSSIETKTKFLKIRVFQGHHCNKKLYPICSGLQTRLLRIIEVQGKTIRKKWNLFFSSTKKPWTKFLKLLVYIWVHRVHVWALGRMLAASPEIYSVLLSWYASNWEICSMLLVLNFHSYFACELVNYSYWHKYLKFIVKADFPLKLLMTHQKKLTKHLIEKNFQTSGLFSKLTFLKSLPGHSKRMIRSNSTYSSNFRE